MHLIIIAVVIVSVIGLIAGLGLAVASKVMAVPVDEKAEEIQAALPGANCGACGYTGCDGYAKALLEPGTKTNLCVPGADAVAAQIAALLGVEAEDVVEKIAVVQCAGTCEATSVKADYRGIPSCAAAKLFYGGNGSCIFGCMGFGDCARACPKGAISCLTMPSLDAVQELLHLRADVSAEDHRDRAGYHPHGGALFELSQRPVHQKGLLLRLHRLP